MAVLLPVIKAGVRLGGAAILALVLATPTLPAVAASPHFQFGHGGGNGNGNGNGGSPYNMDADPCLSQSGRRHAQACPPQRDQAPRRDHGPRAPGSSAFGLQFNSDGG